MIARTNATVDVQSRSTIGNYQHPPASIDQARLSISLPEALIAMALFTRGGVAHYPAEEHETGPTEMSIDSRVTGPID